MYQWPAASSLCYRNAALLRRISPHTLLVMLVISADLTASIAATASSATTGACLPSHLYLVPLPLSGAAVAARPPMSLAEGCRDVHSFLSSFLFFQGPVAVSVSSSTALCCCLPGFHYCENLKCQRPSRTKRDLLSFV